MKRHKFYPIVTAIGLLLSIISVEIKAIGFETITDSKWNKAAVEKVLHAFAFRGFASDQQIKQWARMDPHLAIEEMLTFEPINHALSPLDANGIGDPASYDGSLAKLQDYWSSDNVNNPAYSRRELFNPTVTFDDQVYLNSLGLQETWVQAIATRGVNPFLHKVGLYLTNYHMAISIDKTFAYLMRDYYDSVIQSLTNNASLFEILGKGASSAAVAAAYGHQFNYYDNFNSKFYGNDDFAREFHQLFFKIQGILPGESMDYHEDVTIEHTAWALTGMRLDLVENFLGTTLPFMWFAPPINFTDHPDQISDGQGNYPMIYNFSAHYQLGDGCLEILHQQVCGSTAEEKISNLSQIAGYHPESLINLPVYIIDFFADDNLTDKKKDIIRQAWYLNTNKDLLSFLRSYAISKNFHDDATVKYRSAFDRNLIIVNANTIDNDESFSRYEYTFWRMAREGAVIFQPAHDVFGGQTGLQAANNPNILKDAYQLNVLVPELLGRTSLDNWKKDWAKIIPANANSEYKVKRVAKWLWKRFIGDGKKNYGKFEKAYIEALLAKGTDLGLQISQLDNSDPNLSYSEDDLESELIKGILEANENSLMALNSDIPEEREFANKKIGLAVNFITVTPFMFALEGK